MEKYDGKISAASEPGSRTIHILHFNDVYNFDPAYEEEPKGGASQFSTVLNKLRIDLYSHECKPMILFSGDFVGPSLMSTVTQGAHMIDLFNYLEVDYATFGNHEFDYGYQSLKNRLRGVDDDVTDEGLGYIDYPSTDTKWLMTNMSEGGSGLPLGGDIVDRTALFDWDTSQRMDNGRVVNSVVKVGLLAVSENWLPFCSQLKPGELVYEDYIESARKAARDLKNRGAEVVLAITHNRLDNDYKLTKAVPEIDLLLGGHDHFYKADLPARIVKTGEEWRWASHVTIKLLSDSKKPEVDLKTIDVTSKEKVDKKLNTFLDKYRILQRQKFEKVIYETMVDMDPTEASVRFKESALSNWFCDMCADDYSQAEGNQEAEVVMIMGFPFAGKAVIPAGPFTLGHLMGILPNPITLVVLQLTGADICKSLERGCANLPGECGPIHHVNSRVAYTINLAASGSGGKNTVTDVRFDGAPMDKSRVYSVATTNQMAKGGFGFDWMKRAPRIVEEEYAMQIQDVIIMYCKKYCKDPNRKANPRMGRITIKQC